MVAAHTCCESTLCSFSCNRGELAMVNAVKKAMTMLMPMPERAFIPAGDLVDARHCASFSNPLERAGEFNSVPILTPKLIPLGDCGRITNRNGGSGESRLAACSSRQLAANRFRAHIRLAKEDIRRSGRMQQAGSLRSPDPRLRSRQWNNCNVDVGWTAQRCCSTNRPDDWSGENLFHCFWNSDDCRRNHWLR